MYSLLMHYALIVCFVLKSDVYVCFEDIFDEKCGIRLGLDYKQTGQFETMMQAEYAL
jgi:hypothetical protein